MERRVRGHASLQRGISTAVSSSPSFPPFPPPLAHHLRPRSAATQRLMLTIPADGGEDAPRYGALEGEGIHRRAGRSWCKLGSTSIGPGRQLELPEAAIERRCNSPGVLNPSSSDPLTSTPMPCESTRQGLRGALPPARHQVMKPGL
jgi:hypothetical protein